MVRVLVVGLAGAVVVAGSGGANADSGRVSSPQVPQSYADTCRLVSSWCQVTPTPGGVPDSLRRPLHLPTVAPGGQCPSTSGQSISNDSFGGIALGQGLVQPLVGTRSWKVAERGVLVFPRPRDRPSLKVWRSVKTLWFAEPAYQGPLLIRGRQLDGPHETVFGEGPTVKNPQLGPGPTLNGTNGWREWPGGTWLRRAGCYAWQVDGTDFSHVIVFKAVFARR
jgi:hypothetical protein